jgi:predicted RNA-binding protein associated with RNAse of E/G family
MTNITVIKQDHTGEETWRYLGNLISRQDYEIKIEAFFDREDTQLDEIILIRGDQFLETYYSDRWYNIFEIKDKQNGKLKCWYCNIGYPAVITDDLIAYRDLALDLLVYPDGRQLVLDEDEFSALPISPEDQASAQQALKELQIMFQNR